MLGTIVLFIFLVLFYKITHTHIKKKSVRSIDPNNRFVNENYMSKVRVDAKKKYIRLARKTDFEKRNFHVFFFLSS